MKENIIMFVNDCEANTTLAHKFVSNSMEDIDKLVNSLKENDIRKVSTYEEFSKILKIDVDFVGSTFKFEPVASKKTIIIFDNADYNSTYLVDVFNEAVNMFSDKIVTNLKTWSPIDVNVVYIDNLYLRLLTFNPFISLSSKRPELNFFETQRDNIAPCVFLVNSSKECEVATESQLGVITVDNVMEILRIAYGISKEDFNAALTYSKNDGTTTEQ